MFNTNIVHTKWQIVLGGNEAVSTTLVQILKN